MSNGTREHATLVGSGKVRDLWDAGDALVLVASDRVSVYDVILPTPIPDKGRVLTGVTLFWLEQTRDLVDNHFISAAIEDFPEPLCDNPDMAGRAMLVRKADPILLECVARGYLAGSGWREYRDHGTVNGVQLPEGLVESDRLPEPIFTPSTKAAEGHDLPLSPAEAEELVGKGLAEKLRELTLSIYERGAAVAADRGIILADTKFEFGFCDGELILIDEVMTPDSSRFWPADQYRAGGPQPSYDKQFVRDWSDATGWDHTEPGPPVPTDIVAATAARYREAYERLTGESLAVYKERLGG